MSSPLPRGKAFIDFPNITSGGHAYGNVRFNFSGIVKVLTDGTRNIGVTAYVVNKGNRNDFFREMDHYGITVEAVSPGKSVDGRLIFDLLNGAIKDEFDVAILASGDRDFVRVVQAVKLLHKQVWIASYPESISQSLRAYADKFIDLDQHVKELVQNRKFFSTNCSDCGNPCQVPFQPLTGVPVYCRACLPKHRK
jgi:CxxC-x17-CxxC domain-containing protein